MRDERRRTLAAAQHNVTLLGPDDVELELLTDSWADLGDPGPEPDIDPPPVEDVLAQAYGLPHVVPVFGGRFAEGLLCRALFPERRSGLVLTNGLFPTTRFHLRERGLDVVEIAEATPSGASADSPFSADLDREQLDHYLRSGQVAAVYVEASNNALGGQPLSMAGLRYLRDATHATGIPLILDAARVFENACLIREREAEFASAEIGDIARQMGSLVDAVASSVTKDFRAPTGGFTATRDPHLFAQLRGLSAIYWGTGLNPRDRVGLARRVAGAEPEGWHARTRQVSRIHEALLHAGIPVVGPPGGHAVYIDAARMLPSLARDEHPAEALCAALFVVSGVRSAPNLRSDAQARASVTWIRLALPLGGLSEPQEAELVAALRQVQQMSSDLGGLRCVGSAPGPAGEFVRFFEPAST